jgi:hypothetical protein
MSTMFDKPDSFPRSVLGPGMTIGATTGALSKPIAAAMERGTIPILLSNDQRATAISLGRMGAAWVPARVAMDLFDRGANYSSVDPITANASISGGVATITLTAPSGTLTDATYRGRDYRFAAVALDVNTSQLTTPGQVTWSISGYFEDMDVYTQSLTLIPGLLGTARYYLLFTQQTQGGAYPALVTLQRDILSTPPGVDIVGLSGGDAFTFSANNGIRGGVYSIVMGFTGFDGTGLTATLLDPASMLWDDAYSRWLAAANASVAA